MQVISGIRLMHTMKTKGIHKDETNSYSIQESDVPKWVHKLLNFLGRPTSC